MNLHVCKVRHACEKHSDDITKLCSTVEVIWRGKNKGELICQNSCCQNPVPKLCDKKWKANEDVLQALSVLKREVASNWEGQKKASWKSWYLNREG